MELLCCQWMFDVLEVFRSNMCNSLNVSIHKCVLSAILITTEQMYTVTTTLMSMRNFSGFNHFEVLFMVLQHTRCRIIQHIRILPIFFIKVRVSSVYSYFIDNVIFLHFVWAKTYGRCVFVLQSFLAYYHIKI